VFYSADQVHREQQSVCSFLKGDHLRGGFRRNHIRSNAQMRPDMPGCSGRFNQEISMKNRLTIISRVSITAIALGSLSFAWSAAGQNRSPSRTDASASLSAKDKTFMRNAAKGGMMEVAL